MAQIFTVQLTEGNSEGNYDVYYNQVGNSYFATATTTNELTRNLTFGVLSNGINIAIPNEATSIIILGLSCNNTFTYPVTPISPVDNSPVLCFSYGVGTITEYLTFTPNVISDTTGKPTWTSGPYTIGWNNSTSRWELFISKTLIFVSYYTSSDLVPDGNWEGLGETGRRYITNISRNACVVVKSLSVRLTQTPNTCFIDPKNQQNCDGNITVTASGGVPPYYYSIDGTNFQNSPAFNNLCPNTYTIITKDSQGTIDSSTITVENGAQPGSYTITIPNGVQTMSSSPIQQIQKNNWALNIPSLNAGTTFNIILTFQNVRTIGLPGTGNITDAIEVYKNGSLVDASSRDIVETTELRGDCAYYKNVTLETITYLIEYVVGTTISGTCTSTLNLTAPTVINDCATQLSDIVNLSVDLNSINCICCDIQGLKGEILMNNILTATILSTLTPICLNYGNTCYSALNVQTPQTDSKPAPTTCLYQTYYSTDNQINRDSILYTGNTSPLIHVGAGFYATEVSTGYGTIYETNSSGNVINILDANNTSCSNTPIQTYKYYEVRKSFCGSCGNIVSESVYVAVDSDSVIIENFYYTTGPNSDTNSPVYRIKNGPYEIISEIYENIIDASTGSQVCSSAC
jgi:hypothetical protein